MSGQAGRHEVKFLVTANKSYIYCIPDADHAYPILMRNRLIGLVLLGTFFLSGTSLHGQFLPMSPGTVNVCSGVFTDSGGTGGNYGPNETLVMTICPDGSTGTHTRLSFSGIDIQPGDSLCFFDGPNIIFPQLACNTDFLQATPFIVQATPTNPSGCITVRFKSNATNHGKGWTAIISCTPACQAFEALILTADPAPVPADTGWIDICPGEEVSFSGGANFFQNDLLYHQELPLSIFEWDFGDGTMQDGLSASHVYTQPGGYKATLSIIDQFGCRNTNYLTRRIRVAPPPDIRIENLPGPVCFMDTIELSASSDSSGSENVKILSREAAFDLVKIRADSIPLPDGTGALYQTSLIFTEFGPDQILTDPSQIESICVNMEHSWMRDLRITLTCPTGQTIVLVNQEETGEEVFLGIPFEDDELLPEPVPGQGFTYCWEFDAPNPSWLDYANQHMPQTLPEGSYLTYEAMDGLLGCPLNGEWVLSIQDLWAIDNGYVFWWNIAFDQGVLPPSETFRPKVTKLEWEQAGHIFLHKGKDIQGTAHTAGTTFFRLLYEDDFACVADTFVTIPVLPPTHSQCLDCQELISPMANQEICQGDTAILETLVNGFMGDTIPFAMHAMQPLGYSNHPPSNPYGAPLTISNIFPLTLSPGAAEIESVCFNLQTYPVNNISVFLEAPDGSQLELTTYNGGLGTNYSQTCFSPGSNDPVTAGTAPFSGTYRPEGNWNSLTGAPINGTWYLRISDNFGFNRMGLFENWSMTLKATNEVTYAWSPSTGLSCTDCPQPQAYPDQSQTYALIAQDRYGCEDKKEVLVEVTPVFPAPLVTCGESLENGLMISWSSVPGATAYEVNINQTGWVPANGGLSHLITGIPNHNAVQIVVRAVPLSVQCPSEEATLDCFYSFCLMYAVLEQATPPSCYGGNDGEAYISAYDGTTPFTYNLDNLTTQGFGYFNTVAAGDHFVIVTDGNGCIDSVFFNLNQPDPIGVLLDIDSVSCFGASDGQIEALASGGTPGYNYTWLTVPAVFSPILSNRPAAGYTLRVRDANQCLKDTLVMLPQPALLEVFFQTDTVTCFGASNGTATGTPSGGNGGYQFQWSDGQNSPLANQLAAGNFGLTVTDWKGCTASGTVNVPTVPDNVYATSFQPPTCFGDGDGQAWVNVIQAPAPVQFSWKDPASQSTDTAFMLAAGPLEVWVTDALGCRDTLTLLLPQPDTMDLSILPGMATCPGSSDGEITVVVQSGGLPPYTFVWSDPMAQTDSLATGLPSGTYSVTVTDARGCWQAISGGIPMADGIDVQITGTSASCATSTDGSATAVVTGGTWPYQFRWSDPGMSTDSVLVQVSPGLYTVTVTGAQGCTGTDTVLIGSQNDLKIDSITLLTPDCYGGTNGTIQVFASGGTGNLSFAWSDPSAPSGPVASGLGAGSYTISITDDAGCQITGQALLDEPPPIGIQMSGNDVACHGGSDGSLTATPAGGTGVYQFAWSTTPAQSGPTAFQLPAGTWTVTVTDENGCTETASGAVDEPVMPLEVVILSHLQGCAGGTGHQIEAVITGGTGPAYQVIWEDQSTALVRNQLAAGTYSVTVTDEALCTATAQLTVVDLDPVQIALSGVSPTCHGWADGTVQVDQISGGSGMGDPGQYQYQWNTNPVQTGLTATGLTGDADYQVTATDMSGCTGTATLHLDQPDILAVTTEWLSPRCQGGLDGMASILQITGGSGNYVVQWANGGLDWQWTGLSAGTYAYTVTDTQGCATSGEVIIPDPPTLDVQLGYFSPPSCPAFADGEIRLQTMGGVPPYAFEWSNGSTGHSVSGLIAGNYEVTVSDATGCTHVETWSLSDPEPVEVVITGDGPDCQEMANGQIELTVSGGTPPYKYQLNLGPLQDEPVFSRLGPSDYSVRVYDAKGCIRDAFITLADPLAFMVDAGDDVTIEQGDTVRLLAETDIITPVDFRWTAPVSGTLDCTDCEAPLAYPLFTTTYTVHASDERGCQTRDVVTVWVKPNRTVLVPTAFTPNKDGQNDLLLVHGKEGIRIIVMRVFDRWGELMFEVEDFMINDLSIGWNGEFRGEDMSTGVYIWVLDVEYADGFREQLSGQTTLIR